MIRMDWKSKQKRKLRHANNNPGGQKKGPNCQTDPTKKYFYTSPKAFRHPDYASWHEEIKKINKGGS